MKTKEMLRVTGYILIINSILNLIGISWNNHSHLVFPSVILLLSGIVYLLIYNDLKGEKGK